MKSPAELLHIVEKAHGHPNLKAIHDLAMLELEEVNAEAEVELADRAKEKARKAVENAPVVERRGE